jgi:hypothetical protein
MEAVNPENRVVDTIADAIRSVVLGDLRDPTEPERAQNYIVKGGGTGDVRDTDACMVDHRKILNLLTHWSHQVTTRNMSSTSLASPRQR